MKKMLLLLMITAAVFQLGAKELKVLAIGNSFSVCVIRNLPQIVASVPGHRIILTSAGIGGCSLQRHWKEWKTAEKNPAHRPYGVSVADSKSLKTVWSRGNLQTLLKQNKYDIITIQQNSSNSWKEKSYQPYAGLLIAELKKYQPQAEIVIQQTWSYRSDASRLKRWKIDNTFMYQQLEAAYAKLAKTYGFRVIPSGKAVQVFRSRTTEKFVPVEPSELKKYKRPAVPSFAGDVVGRHAWRKNRKTKKISLVCDSSHLNPHGEYLQAAVWFSILFGEPATAVKYVPKSMKPEQAEFLLKCAQEAVSTFKQPGK